MLTFRRRAMLTLLKLCDLFVVGTAYGLAMMLAIGGLRVESWPMILELRISVLNAIFVVAYTAAWHYLLSNLGLYASYRLAPAAREIGRIGIAVAIGSFSMFAIAVPLQFEYATPAFLVAFATFAFVGLTVERRLARVVARFARRHGMNLRNIVIVADPNGAAQIWRDLSGRAELGYVLLDTLELDGSAAAAEQLGALKSRIDTLAATQGIDEVFISLPFSSGDTELRALISHCEMQGITVRVVSRIADLAFARVVIDEIAGQPVLSIFSGPTDSPRLAVKRVIDLCGATLGLVLGLPLFLLVAIMIKLDSPGPVLFRQLRVGLNRHRFTAYKFRTMVHGADLVQDALEHLNEARGPIFKIRNDPRVTRVGAWLRRTSIDELPQLLNVLKGEMSLVGPRPLPIRDVERMDVLAHRRRFSMKPGITCLWQATSRQPDFEEWIKADFEYIDRWSLALDLKIIFKTIPAIFTGTGVH